MPKPENSEHALIPRLRDELHAITKPDSLIRKLFVDLSVEAGKQLPGIGPFVDLGKTIVKGLADIETQESQYRLEAYAMGVLEGEYDRCELRDQDVIPVIRKLMADDEAAKTEYYTRLTLNLGRQSLEELPHDDRYYFIGLVSSLTCYQIEFARELKIRQTVPVCGTVSCEAAELAHTGQKSGKAIQALRTLQNAGLLTEKAYAPRDKKPDGVLYDTTDVFATLMQLLFHPGDFVPEIVNLQRKDISDIILVGTPGFIDNLYKTYLPAALRKAGLKVTIVERGSDFPNTMWAPLYLHTGVEEDSAGKKYWRLILTEGSNFPLQADTNYIDCRFEEKRYLQQRSQNTQDADHFRKEMNRVVSGVQTQLNRIRAPASQG